MSAEAPIRLAFAGSGYIVLGAGGRASLSEAEWEALRPLCLREYFFPVPRPVSRIAVFFLSAGAEPQPRPGAKLDPASFLLPGGMSALPLRAYATEAPEEEIGTLFRAFHLLQWREKMLFCPHCASPLREQGKLLALLCPQCGLLDFPRISPAVITLIEHEGKILLARNANFSNGMHSLIAGFVEAGETIEETVAREVFEEVGLAVADVRYAGSQGWPFPDSLMLGFTARAESGEIKIDGAEIVEAGWFGSGDRLPPLARPGSIARRLIDAWFAEHPA
jgi:NAD+ diphosphatase